MVGYSNVLNKNINSVYVIWDSISKQYINFEDGYPYHVNIWYKSIIFDSYQEIEEFIFERSNMLKGLNPYIVSMDVKISEIVPCNPNDIFESAKNKLKNAGLTDIELKFLKKGWK